MITYIAQAITWGLSRVFALGRGGRETLSHENRAHAHWDRARREWVMRGVDIEETLDRAA